MKKLNKINIFYIALVVLLVGLNVNQIFRYKFWDRYYYSVQVSVPPYYPIFIRDCYFSSPYEGDDWVSPDSENENDLQYGQSVWGDFYDWTSFKENNRLPNKFNLSYIDYRTKNYYEDSIQISPDGLKQIFKNAETKNSLIPDSSNKAKLGLVFLVGIANDGNVMMSLNGKDFSELIFTKKIKPRKIPDEMREFSNMSKEEYDKWLFQNLSDSMKTIIDGGINKNAQYKDSVKSFMKNRPRY